MTGKLTAAVEDRHMLVLLLVLQLKSLEESGNSSWVVRLQFQFYEILLFDLWAQFIVLWQIRTICILKQMTSVKRSLGVELSHLQQAPVL